MSKLQIVGIDLGTTNSEIYKIQDGVPMPVIGPNNTRITSSSVVVDNVKSVDEVVYALRGAALRNVLRSAPGNYIYEPKRILGRTFEDDYIKRDVHFWPFMLVEGDDGLPYYEVQGKGTTFTLSPVDVDAQILRTMKSYAKEGVEDVVITIPAYFSESQRAATQEAGEKAGFKVHKLIPEPIAAAIAYARSHEVRNHNILVYDLGGGTFDCCLILFSNNRFEVLAKNGHSHLGGADFDNAIVKYICEEYQKKFNIDLQSYPKQMKELKEKATQVKIILSNEESAPLHMDAFEITDNKEIPELEHEFTRAEFEGLIEKQIDTTINFIKSMLQEMNMTIHNVDDVVCVGGSTYIPLVRNKLTQFFNREIDFRAVDIFEAVAEGAAIYADELMKGNDLIMDNIAPLVELKPPKIFEVPYPIYYNTGKGYECIFDPSVMPNKDFSKKDYNRSVSNYDLYYERDVSTVQVDLYRCRDGQTYEIFGRTRFELNEPIAKRSRYDNGGDVIMKFDLNNYGILNCTFTCTQDGQKVQKKYYCRGDELDDNDEVEKVKKIVEYENEAKTLLNSLMDEGNAEEVAEKRERIMEFMQYLNEFALDDGIDIIEEEYARMRE